MTKVVGDASERRRGVAAVRGPVPRITPGTGLGDGRNDGKAAPPSGLVRLLSGMFGRSGETGAIALDRRPDRTLRSRRQLEQALEGVCVAELLCQRDAAGKEPGSARMVVSVVKEPQSAFAQALRGVGTFIAAAAPARPMTIGIVSWSPGEGRSTVAGGLALLLGASREVVTLIDADFRNPSLSRALTPQAEIGLDQALLDPAARALPLAVVLGPTLDFIPAVARGGACNPHAFVGSPEMRHLLTTLREGQHVLVDLPPMSRSGDVEALASLLDGVILVAEADRTTMDDLSNARRVLQEAGTTIFGAVLNKSPDPAASARPPARSGLAAAS